MSSSISFGDEGIIAYGAFRIYQGEVPFRDFFSAITPFSFYLFAFLFKLFGPSLLALRLGVLLISISLLLAIWMAMARMKVKSFLAYLLPAAFATYFGGPVWFIASHHWLSVLFCIAALALLLNEESEVPTLPAVAIAGFLSALAAATLQHRGSLWIICGSFVFLLLPRTQRFKPFIAYWFGIAFCAIPMAIYFVFVVGWDTLFYDLITFPLNQYHNFIGHKGTVYLSLSKHWNNCLSAWLYLQQPLGLLRLNVWYASLVGMIIVCTLPFITLVLLFHLWKTKACSSYCIGCLTAFFASSYISSLHRLTDTTLIYAAPAALIVVSLASDKIIILSRKNVKSARILISLFLGLFFSVGVGQSALTELSPKITTVTPAGIVETLSENESKTMHLVSEFAKYKWKEGETVFCYPYHAFFYFLYRLKNPTPYDTLTWPMHTELQLNETQHILERSLNQWIIADAQLIRASSSNKFEQYLNNMYTIRKFCGEITIFEVRQF